LLVIVGFVRPNPRAGVFINEGDLDLFAQGACHGKMVAEVRVRH
jgi:hypothetical protein